MSVSEQEAFDHWLRVEAKETFDRVVAGREPMVITLADLKAAVQEALAEARSDLAKKKAEPLDK